MPLYEYQCEKCGNVFERIQKYSDAPLTVHEGCGGKVEKLISASGFHLKGSGWYATDYARAGSKSDAKADSADTPKKETTETKADGSGTKSDPKPSSESKTESKTASKPAPAAKSD
jgi:putative FmdB family regulatory protein